MQSIAIVLLNYNTAAMTDALARYLREVLVYPDKDVFVIDNGSSAPPASVTHNLPINIGFTCGMHEGYKIASAARHYDAYWFLNSDIAFDDGGGVLADLVAVLFSSDHYAQIAPQHNSPHPHMRNANAPAQIVPWLEPTATLIKASTIERVGFWELACTLGWGIDYDYGFRIKQAGLQSILTDRARIVHREHGSQANQAEYGARAQEEMVRVLRRKYGDTWYRIVSPALVTSRGSSAPPPTASALVGMLPLAVCAIFRNESPYLQEWIEFHRIMGVEKFYLYQNRSDDDWQSVLQPYVERGLVEVTDWSMPGNCQGPAYRDCFAKQRGKALWLAVIDIDEFLFSPKFATVPKALATLPDAWGAVGVNWLIFGASGREEYSPEPVIERFTLRPGDHHHVNTHIKSVVRMARQVAVRGDAHHFEVSGSTFNENGVKVTGAHSPAHTSSLLRINHYCTKSRQEYYKRIALGRVDGVGYVARSVFDERQDHAVDDRTIQRFLPALKARLKADSEAD
jgi:GT2 family glycosyltransferase